MGNYFPQRYLPSLGDAASHFAADPETRHLATIVERGLWSSVRETCVYADRTSFAIAAAEIARKHPDLVADVLANPSTDKRLVSALERLQRREAESRTVN